MKGKPSNLGYTGTIGGSLKDRPAKRALTGDEREQLRGSSAVLETRIRNLRDVKHPRRKSESRAVTVTYANGTVVRLSSKLKPPTAHTERKRREALLAIPAKRTRLATDYVMGDTWASKGAADDSFKGTARKCRRVRQSDGTYKVVPV